MSLNIVVKDFNTEYSLILKMCTGYKPKKLDEGTYILDNYIWNTSKNNKTELVYNRKTNTIEDIPIDIELYLYKKNILINLESNVKKILALSSNTEDIDYIKNEITNIKNSKDKNNITDIQVLIEKKLEKIKNDFGFED